MKKIVKNGLTVVCVITIALGVFFHYLYELSGCNKIVALFCPINESVWEHLKLIYFPILITSIGEYLLLWKYTEDFTFINYANSKILSIFIATAFTLIAFYTYSGILGKSLVVIDISIYVLSIGIAYFSFIRLHFSDAINSKNLFFVLLSAFIILGLMFFIFTFKPPKIALFKDPINGTYGIQ